MIHTLTKGVIEKFLKRMKSRESEISGPELDEVLKEILSKANEFVPSEAGSILLDDPGQKADNPDDPSKNILYFVACFGPRSEGLLGMKLSAATGIAGHTYITGHSYISADTAGDKYFNNFIDIHTKEHTSSVLCVPIVIGNSVCGVIELVNRRGFNSYTTEDLKLLEIFAAYTSTLIQNSLDAKRNQELTRRDDLTGLYNDRYFHQQLSDDLKAAKETRTNISLLFMDLDNFKYVNDTMGHLAGSRTLAEVGRLLNDTLESDDVRIIRYGGDEFAMILPGKDRSEAARLAEKVRVAIQDAVFLSKSNARGEQAYHIKGVITCSIGIASFFEDGLDSNVLEDDKIGFIREADRAMYKAKELGKNCIYLGEKSGTLIGPSISAK